MYLGTNYSLDLDFSHSRPLGDQLPNLYTFEDLWKFFDLDASRLQWLAFHKELSTVDHYYRFYIPKRKGGRRRIASPKSELAKAQRKIKTEILDQIAVHFSAMGYRKNFSIVSNAQHHVGKAVVVNADIENFFQSIKLGKVRKVFRDSGYNKGVSTVLALLCTDSENYTRVYDGRKYYFAYGGRHLPQGSITSPALSNLCCRNLDEKLFALADDLFYTYTRYSDDLSFSSEKPMYVGVLLRKINILLQEQGFSLNTQKTKVQRTNRNQIVTGLSVNEKVNVPRLYYRRFRAFLNYCEKSNLQDELSNKILGRLNYYKSINLNLVGSLSRRYPWVIDLKGNFEKFNPKVFGLMGSYSFFYNSDLGVLISQGDKSQVFLVRDNHYINIKSQTKLVFVRDKDIQYGAMVKFAKFKEWII